MHAGELFQNGRLSEAIAAAIQEVKDQPGDLSRRTLLFSLLCFEGDLSRARKQLDVVGNQATLTEAPLYEGLLAAEETRRKVLTDGQRPRFFDEVPARLEKHLQAICRIKERRFTEAKVLLDAAEEERLELRGSLDGVVFDDFADANDITRSFLEFQQGHEYYWVPLEQLAHLQVLLPDPARPRDLYWAPCQLILKGGEVQRGFTPGLYASTFQATDTSLKLGHGTHFSDIGGGIYSGQGRKQFVAGDDDPTVLELADVTFD
jgi:type VI secretion system protein ImpE